MLFKKSIHLLFDIRGGNIICSREVNNFAMISEEIKFARPVVADGEGIDGIFLDVINLLLPASLGNDQIDAFHVFDDLLSLIKWNQGFLPFLCIEFVGRNRHG